MASTLSLFGRQWLLRRTFRAETAVDVGVSSLEVALHRNVVDASAISTALDEPSGALNYGRKAIAFGNVNWTMNAQGEVVYGPELLWDPPFGDWGQLVGWSLVAAGGTNLIASGTINLPRRIGVGTRPRIPASTIRIGLYD